MFWLTIQRSLYYYRKRVVLLFLTLVAFASVLSVFVNLTWDVQKKVRRELRSSGANFMIFPAASSDFFSHAVDEKSIRQAMNFLWSQTTSGRGNTPPDWLENLYGVGHVKAASRSGAGWSDAILAGVTFNTVPIPQAKERIPRQTGHSSLIIPNPLLSWWQIQGNWPLETPGHIEGLLGSHLATELGITAGKTLILVVSDHRLAENKKQEYRVLITGLVTTGSSEDYQFFIPLKTAQVWLDKPGQISLAQARLTGSSASLSTLADQLKTQIPQLRARPLYQFTLTEETLFRRIRMIFIPALILLIILSLLILSSLFSASLVERQKEIALLSVLGASWHHLVRFLVGELSLILIGASFIGYFIGFSSACFLERVLFSTSLTFSWKPLAIVLASMLFLPLPASLFPLYTIRHTQPAILLKQE